jgi:hypothetical protein
LRRLPEHLLPSRRFAHDPRLWAAEFVREHPHARVELTGPGAVVSVVARRGRQLLVRHDDSDVVHDAARKGQMPALVGVWMLRPEREAEHLSAGPHGGREQ